LVADDYDLTDSMNYLKGMIKQCYGMVIIGFKQIFIEKGYKKKGGTPNPSFFFPNEIDLSGQALTSCKRQVLFHKKRHFIFQKCGKLFSIVCGILFSIPNSFYFLNSGLALLITYSSAGRIKTGRIVYADQNGV